MTASDRPTDAARDPTPRLWQAPAGERAARVWTIEAHTEGEPLRVVVSGVPEPRGDSVRQRREDARRHLDAWRTALMWEPRGHADMYGCILVPAEHAGSDFGVLFMHNAGFSSMCGHGVLALARVAVEAGLVERREPVTPVVMDTPAGTVRAEVSVDGGAVVAVRFVNVPSWVVGLDRTVEVPAYGEVRYDLAFGGAFYAYVDAGTLGLELEPTRLDDIVRAGRAIKSAVAEADPPLHPAGSDLSFLYGTVFVGPARQPGRHSRNVCVFADGEVDRSPTGTGVSGRLAIHHARGELEVGEPIEIESIVGTRFTCRIVETTDLGGRPAVVPEVEGRTWITGRAEWWIDPADPLADGFLLR